jgi:putative membrane-bound dehydrogenase-like protein
MPTMTIRASILLLACATPVIADDWKAPKPADKVATDHFKVPDGLEVTVWASTPDLFNPTNMDIDAAGRIWVAEGVNYRRHNGRRPGGDRIAVLEDTDGDGKADKSHTFVQETGLVAPLGVAVFDNVVVVSQPPDLIKYTDVNRDLKFDPAVDKREVLLTGFNARNHDHSLHSVTGGPDGKWYFNNGNCGAEFTDKSGKTFRMGGDYYKDGGGDWFVNSRELMGKKSDDGYLWTSGFSARMNPDGTHAEIIGHGYRNSFEHCTTSLGDLFQNDNDDPPACRTSYVLEYGSAGYFTREGRFYRTVKRPNQDHGRNHWRQDDPGTFDAGDIYGGGSPTGIVFYENGALGAKHAGTLLSCEAARNVIFGYQPEPQGATYKLDRTDWMTSNTTGEFVGADFTGKAEKANSQGNPLLFRPSDVAVGADGALYVTDWFDPRVGGHGDMDESCSGTIYRIAPKGFKPVNPKVDLATVEGCLNALKSPAINVRWTGFQGLKAKGDDALDAVLAVTKDKDPWIASRGIWLLANLGPKGEEACKGFLTSPDTRQRLVAYRALKRAGKDILPIAEKLASDPVAAVRRDVALSLRGLPAEKSAPLLIAIAKGWDGKDKNYLESIGLAAENQENEVWKAMKAALAPGAPKSWNEAFAKLTWRLWPSTAIADLKARALDTSLSPDARSFACESLSFIDDKAAADALFEVASGPGSSVKDAAVGWLFMRGTGSWAKFGLHDELKKRNIYDPDKIQLQEAIFPGKPDKTNFTTADVMKLKGDAAKGKAVAARCIMCHQIDGAGPAYGPELKGWVSRQGAEMAVRAIVDPSAEIAHGFDGTAIQLKDNRWIDGLVRSNGDPVVVTSQGGITQMVPKNRIQEMRGLGRSLMLNADQLGMSAQDVADAVEWMKTYK